MSPLETILERLEGVRKVGKSHEARCPAHADRKPSLSVTEAKDGRVLVRCHAGCETKDVLAAIDLTMGELFPERPGAARADIVGEYDYVDEGGELLFQVVRLAPKSFRQRRPDGAGGWEWKLGDTHRVLYRLPKVLEAARKGEPVYVCEGEKDALAVERAGGVATCNPMGAGEGKWRDSYSQSLAGAHVVVVEDQDDPGRAHAAAVAKSVTPYAASVKVVRPLEGHDASDHLQRGHGLDAFAPVEVEAEQSTQESDGARAVPFSAIERELVKWLWPGRVPLGMLSLLVGDPGLGKSLLTCDLAARTSRAGAAVVMISAEDSKGATARRGSRRPTPRWGGSSPSRSAARGSRKGSRFPTTSHGSSR